MPTISGHTDRLQFLERLAVETTQSVGGQLIEAFDTTTQTGHDSIDFSINIADGPRTYVARYMLIGDSLYQMRAVFMNDASQNARYKQFFDSFKNK
jgi:hypothetical protein